MARAERLMQPLRLSLGIFGICHRRQKSEVNPAIDDPAKKTSIIVKRSTENFLRFYCVFVCTLLSLNVLRYLPSFWVGIDFIPNLTSLRIITLLFYLQNAIVSIVLFIFYDNRNHFESYVKQYIDAVEDQISKSLMLNPKSNRIRKCGARNLAIGWTYFTINASLTIFAINTNFSPVIPVLACNPFPNTSLSVRVLASFVQIISSGVSIFPVVMFCTLVSAIEFLYDDLYDVMKQTTIEQSSCRLDIFKNIRKKHLQLCKMVETVDQSLQFYVAAVFVINLGIACFTTYEMINKSVPSTDLAHISILSFWLAFAILTTLIITKKAATLHEKVITIYLSIHK